ncbi:hypothetical protein BGZ63DRAFT_440882 [Mariannaea sp. PMI_226]|nr:hypothetical protein BGZ63DRAFT_440882 [Mariannaea sp. PMI_226]
MGQPNPDFAGRPRHLCGRGFRSALDNMSGVPPKPWRLPPIALPTPTRSLPSSPTPPPSNTAVIQSTTNAVNSTAALSPDLAPIRDALGAAAGTVADAVTAASHPPHPALNLAPLLGEINSLREEVRALRAEVDAARPPGQPPRLPLPRSPPRPRLPWPLLRPPPPSSRP